MVEKDVEMFLEACELKGLSRYSFRRRWQGRFGSGSSIKTAIVKAGSHRRLGNSRTIRHQRIVLRKHGTLAFLLEEIAMFSYCW